MALVGVHIVGNVAGHPEMLWATFEHENNAPRDTYGYINKSKKSVVFSADTTGDWTFYDAGSKQQVNISHMKLNDENIIAIPNFTISPSNTSIINPWGCAGNPPNPEVESVAQSNSQIISINNNVRRWLAEGDARKYYLIDGTTWTLRGKFPDGEYQMRENEVGTSTLANSTIETYFQGHNCFFCHTNNKNDYTGLSHIFGDIIGLGNTPSSPKEAASHENRMNE